MASPAFTNLTPRLKELLNENKDLLSKPGYLTHRENFDK